MEHVALYRLYRPMNFDDIVEQEHAVSALRQSVLSGKIGHAYLFCGTRGTGKTSIAKVFSRAINCQHPVNGNPCNECEICKGVIDGSLLDVIEMDAASNNSVDNIRRICDEVMFMPAKAKYKVYIIDEVHMLSTGAFNALLKTLEEPPAHAVFLLATTEPHRIPATILSRCQRYDFRRIPSESIVKRLGYIAQKQNISIEQDALSAIASIGDGALRDSISLLDQVSTTSNGKTITRDDILRITGIVDEAFLHQFASAILEGRAADLLPLCKELTMDGRDLIRFTLDLAQYFRNILVTQVSANPQALIESTSSAIAQMRDLGRRTDTATILFFITRLSDLAGELKWSPSARTSFEIMMLRLASRGNKIIPAVVPSASAPASPSPAPAPQAASVSAPAAPAPSEIPAAQPAPAAPAVAQPVASAPAPAPVPAPSPAPVPVSESKAEPNKEEPKAPQAPSVPDISSDMMLPPPLFEETPENKASEEKKPEVKEEIKENKAEIKKEPKSAVKAEEDFMPPPPVVDDMMAPPPAPDMDFMVPPPLPEDAPEEEDIPLPPPPPTVEELAHTQPSSPNLHKAFSADHVNEGQRTNLAKAVKEPEVRAPHMPTDILMPDGVDAPKREAAPVSNLNQVMRHGNGDECDSARREFMDYLKVEHTFEYMYMGDSKVFWQDQTVWCIMPDSFAATINDVRDNAIIVTQLLKICQKYEPALLHVRVATQKEYEASGNAPVKEESNQGNTRPDWVKAVEDVSEKNGITLTHVKDL